MRSGFRETSSMQSLEKDKGMSSLLIVRTSGFESQHVGYSFRYLPGKSSSQSK